METIITAISLGLVTLCALGLVAWALLSGREANKLYAQHLAAIAESSMAHAKASTLSEKVQTDITLERAKVQIAQLKDALAAQSKLEEAKTPPAPQFVKTEDGEMINLNDYEEVF